MSVAYEVVIPTLGRPSLVTLLDALASVRGPRPTRIVLVDDRRHADGPLVDRDVPTTILDLVDVVPGRATGPAAARNDGWRTTLSDWVAFLDDDVVPEPDWATRLVADLEGLGSEVAGSQGRVTVPRPVGRRPTDWERNVAGLENAAWATADMAFRRTALLAAGGFDERFPRAYREDADLAIRLRRAGWRLVRGGRGVVHPVRPSSLWTSVRSQAGNRDDALMWRLHGSAWRAEADAPAGRFPRHLLTAVGAAAALIGAASRRRRFAATGAALFTGGVADLAVTRVRPGPRTAREVATMAVTSAVLPVAAVVHRAAGLARVVIARPKPITTRGPQAPDVAVLFDRDGTLVRDVPYNGDPALVSPMPGAADALDRLRAAGIPVGIISNQSGVARGVITERQVHAVHRRVEELLGPFATWQWCPHGPEDGCACRKPSPGMIHTAASAVGVAPGACVVLGDIGADVEAAEAAGARGMLVPTAVTRAEEIDAAHEVVGDLAAAVDLIVKGCA